MILTRADHAPGGAKVVSLTGPLRPPLSTYHQLAKLGAP